MDPEDLAALGRLLGRTSPSPGTPQPTTGQMLADALDRYAAGDPGAGASASAATDEQTAPDQTFTPQQLADGLQAYGSQNAMPAVGGPPTDAAPDSSGSNDGVYRPGAGDPATAVPVQYAGPAHYVGRVPSKPIQDADRLEADVRNLERAFDYQDQYGGLDPAALQRQFEQTNAAVDRTIQVLQSSNDPDASLRIQTLQRAAGLMAFHAQNIHLKHWNTNSYAGAIRQVGGAENDDALQHGLEAEFGR